MKNTGIMLSPDTDDLDIRVVLDLEGRITEGLYVNDVTRQNTAIILHMQPGELKEHPAIGVGISNMLLDHDYLLYKHKIRQQLSADGMQIDHLAITDQNIEINASYK